MSGLEAVGLCLAVFPIVIEMVERYSGLVTGRDIKHLAESLKNNEQIFVNTVETLLRSTVPAPQLVTLLSDLEGDLWRDDELRRSVSHKLGQGADIVLDKISDIYKTVLKLKEKLPVSQKSVQRLVVTLTPVTLNAGTQQRHYRQRAHTTCDPRNQMLRPWSALQGELGATQTTH
jgi:hypothetical protein